MICIDCKGWMLLHVTTEINTVAKEVLVFPGGGIYFSKLIYI